MLKPKYFLKYKTRKILLDSEILTEHLILPKRTNLMFIN